MTFSIDKSTWRKVRFGDVVNNLNDVVRDPSALGIDRVIGLEHLDPGEMAVTRWDTLSDGTSFTRRVRPGQTLFGKRRSYQRKTAYASFDAICSGDILVFYPKDPEVLLPELLPFIASSNAFYEVALRTSAGSLSPRTRWSDMATFEFLLPPLAEQQRIASLLWVVEGARRANIERTATLTSAARSWVDQQLGSLNVELVEFKSLWSQSPDSGCSAPPVGDAAGHRVLSLAALTDAGYRPGQYKHVQPSDAMDKAMLSKGDLLISRANTVDAVGRAAIYPETLKSLSFPDTMMRLHIDKDCVRPEYVVLVLMSRLGRQHMRRTAAGTSTSMVKINRQTLGRFQFPLLTISDQDELLSHYNLFADALTAAKSETDAVASLLRAVQRELWG